MLLKAILSNAAADGKRLRVIDALSDETGVPIGPNALKCGA